MATVIFLVDQSEINVEKMRKRKHELCLLIKEDWFDDTHILEIQKTINEYKKLNPNFTYSDILAIAEQIIIDAGATLVPYNSVSLAF